MILTKKEILPLAIIIVCFAIGLYLYPQLPELIPSHWNTQGDIDNWAGKSFTVFFFPSITLIIYLLMTFLPLIDPLRKNYSKFAFPYFLFRLILVLFLSALYLYTLFVGLGLEMNINYFIIPAVSLFFILIGFFLPKIKKNYFVGIRTPWTIHSEEVWDMTHKFSSKLFIIAGLVSLIGIFIKDYAFAIFITAVLLAGLFSVVYSYFAFRKTSGFKGK